MLFLDIDLKIKRLKIYNYVVIRKMWLILFSILILIVLRIDKKCKKKIMVGVWLFSYILFDLYYMVSFMLW